jgi:hypothetical protein
MTVAEFKAHHDDRGGDYGTSVFADDTAIEVAIVQASDYVDKRFGRRFRGCRNSSAQGLEWPRIDAWSDDDHALSGVPDAMKKAIAEYTMLVGQLGRNLAPTPPPNFPVQDPADGTISQQGSGPVTRKTEKVGPIEDTTEYATPAETGKPSAGTGNLTQNIPEYPQADLWIEEIIEPYSNRRVYRG